MCGVFCGIQRKRSCDAERLDELQNNIAQEHIQLYLFRHRLNSGSAEMYIERLIINEGKKTNEERHIPLETWYWVL